MNTNTKSKFFIGIPIVIACAWMAYYSFKINAYFATLFLTITPFLYFYTVWKNRNKVESKADIKNKSIYIAVIVALGFVMFLFSKQYLYS